LYKALPEIRESEEELKGLLRITNEGERLPS
jgi:hypothetical protein